MNYWLILWAIIAAVVIAHFLTSMQRIDQVARFLKATLDTVALRACEDIKADRDWRWRYTELEKLSFDEMSRKFWRPLESFITDDKFLK